VGAGTEAPDDAGGKGGGERAILLVAVHPEDLVQGAPCQPAARQYPIDRGDAERHYPMRCRRRPLDPPDPLTQRREKGSLLGHVPSLFSSPPFVNADG
jgi:hypothetical protein